MATWVPNFHPFSPIPEEDGAPVNNRKEPLLEGPLLVRSSKNFSGKTIEHIADGRGKLRYPNGQPKYAGYFNDGRAEDSCAEFHKKNGDVYVGPFVNGYAEGLGQIVCENGFHFVGNFQRGYLHGRVKVYFDRDPSKRKLFCYLYYENGCIKV